ncbi:unnamed protein product [Sphagnum balticum]
MKIVVTGGDEQVLRTTKGVQTIDIDVSDEEGSRGIKGEDYSQDLTMNEILAPPLPMDNGRLGYVQREKKSIRLFAARSNALKQKAKKNNSLSKTQAIEDELSNVNLQVDENLLASLNSSRAQTSIASSVNVILRAEGDGQEKECIGEALQDIEPLDTLSPL